ncbi:MAG: carboxypeptidase-like regulatory domain-containing protein [Candidatus Obscuribacter sp.]|nr:carboxypeptidase-like regulatory domain-containing protein [Candidatus Obscuribacter sp.]
MSSSSGQPANSRSQRELTGFTYNLVGHVKHQGLPVANLQIAVFDQYQLFEPGSEPLSLGLTGSRGEFSFAVRPGVYTLRTIPNVEAGTRFLSKSVEDVKVVGNTTVNINLSTGCVIHGRVNLGQYQERGELLESFFASIELLALGIEPSSYRALASLSQTGEFSLVVPRGKYNLALRARSHFEEGAPRFNFLTTRTDVLTVTSDEEININLPDLEGFGGEVVDLLGAPVEGARVTLTPAHLSGDSSPEQILIDELELRSTAVTGPEGKFQFALEPGLYDLVIEPKAGSYFFTYKQAGVLAQASENGQPKRERFTLQEGHRLKGQVVYDTRLLSQALVQVVSQDLQNEYLTRTDGDGQFAISVPSGSYKLTVSAHPKDAPTISIDNIEYASLAPFTANVVVGGETHVAVRLNIGTALYGRVSDDAGQARPGVKVAVYPGNFVLPENGEKELDDALAVASGITDGEGRYCLFLAPGVYNLVVHRDFAGKHRVELKDEPFNLDIVWHGWSQVKFTVFGEDGQPVPRCRVSYTPYGEEPGDNSAPPSQIIGARSLGYPHGFVVTHDDGSCCLTLPSGVYSFKFLPPQAGSYAVRSIRQLSISADVNRKVTLELKEH